MIGWPFAGRRERLRRDASDWLARLNGAHDARDRAAFERWYRADPEHAATYDRLAGLFAAAGTLPPARSAAIPRAAPPPGARRPRARYALAAVAAAGAVAILGYTALGGREPAPNSVDHRSIVATTEAGRVVSLADGSEVVLSPGSTLDVAFDGSQRRLVLRRGEARFAVVHEARPFVVSAQGTEVIARGTQFVVRLDPAGTVVSLIEGRVDVTYPRSPDGGPRRVASMAPGERIVVPTERSAGRAGSAAELSSAPAMIEFDDARLADAIGVMNRQARQRVRLADATLGDLRVTGAFRPGDIDGFARGVAAALGLEATREGDGTLSLARSARRTG